MELSSLLVDIKRMDMKGNIQEMMWNDVKKDSAEILIFGSDVYLNVDGVPVYGKTRGIKTEEQAWQYLCDNYDQKAKRVVGAIRFVGYKVIVPENKKNYFMAMLTVPTKKYQKHYFKVFSSKKRTLEFAKRILN